MRTLHSGANAPRQEATVKRLAFISAILLVLAVAFPAAADDEGNKQSENEGRDHWQFGPYAGASADSGTCGNDWAQDTFKRHFSVTRRADGSYYVREDFKDGKFVTIAGASPGACETGTPHGSTVDAGIRGEFKGWLAGTVTGGTFDPKAVCGTPCTGGPFIAAHFGASAAWNVVPWKFTYEAEHGKLLFRRWQNASDGQGGNRGDIASR